MPIRRDRPNCPGDARALPRVESPGYPRAVADDPAAARLAPLSLLDDEGRPVRLGDLWAKRAVVLAFLRHYG